MDLYEQLLHQSGYDPEKIEYLVQGFRRGFSLEFEGDRKKILNSQNLKLRCGSQLELWNKVMKVVEAKRYAGPFSEPPFEYYYQSPIGLVPKDGGRKTRLIFHLSHLCSGGSMNEGMNKLLCAVKYPDFNNAIELCLKELDLNPDAICYIGKSDMTMAYRHVPLRAFDWPLLVMKAKHPITGQVFYFMDKCLPFGGSISCVIFQKFSNSISHLVTYRTRKLNINYLDDFFFVSLLRMMCNSQVNTFLEVCGKINFPVSLEKTFWGTTRLVFLGQLIDAENRKICLPRDKIIKALDLISFFLNTRNKKATVKQIQQLTDFLNFLCNSIIPGRAFTRHLYSHVNSKMRPYHHIRITGEIRKDLNVWSTFLQNASIFSRPFMEIRPIEATNIGMYSDAAKSATKGFGAICQNSWMFSVWDPDFIQQCDPSIEYLELFGVTAAVLTWIKRFQNHRILLHCDNMSVVHMINASSSSCKNCMVLIRLITLEGLMQNMRIYARHVTSCDNFLMDALLRIQMDRFWAKAPPTMEKSLTKVPESIFPVSKIWVK